MKKTIKWGLPRTRISSSGYQKKKSHYQGSSMEPSSYWELHTSSQPLGTPEIEHQKMEKIKKNVAKVGNSWTKRLLGREPYWGKLPLIKGSYAQAKSEAADIWDKVNLNKVAGTM